MEAKKLVAVFLMCMVVLTAVSNVPKAEATEEEFKDCYNTCHQECSQEGHGYTYCEMKCDTECSMKEIRAQFPKFKA
ncbi:PREDICTED: major pollen allergen Ole e 6-like [Nicotiana attenuata]|uniref:Major pollen allergen ole e 6 n=1 Tax=Nicotiana attenuata TaxID=49451 RepID=A0A314LCL3_NICAT|nr:PREDICTED: major pollen allergen Ole e 6-like [Nicotiana attenuata]OIT39378.1 major pollen allergen ole e 6 [Nicotiana attenuata]